MSLINSKLFNARKSLRADAAKIKEFDGRLKMAAPEIQKIFEMFPPSLRRRVSVSAEAWSETVRFGLSFDGLSSFKDKNLTRLLEKFADWTADTRDYTFNMPNRDFYFTYKHPCGLHFRVGIYAYVKSDSPTCRVVVKGVTTRVVEEEIREIVCE